MEVQREEHCERSHTKNCNGYIGEDIFSEQRVPCVTVRDVRSESTGSCTCRCSQNVDSLMRYMQLEHINCIPKLKRLSKENEELVERLRRIGNQNESLIQELQAVKEKLPEDNISLKTTIDELNQELGARHKNEKGNEETQAALVEKNKRLETKLKDQDEKIEKQLQKRKRLKEKITVLESANTQHDNDIKTKDKILKSLRSKLTVKTNENKQHLNTIDDIKETIYSLETKLKTCENSQITEQQSKTIEQKKHKIKTLENEIKTKDIEIQKRAKYVKEKESIIQSLKAKLNEQARANERQACDLEAQLNVICSVNNQLEDLRRKVAEKNNDNETLKGILSETLKDQDATRSRLSQLMGQKLTDNNPNIADLSDKNRPTKLAERYTELYDNQWTDAYETIDHGDEKSTIDILRDILYNAMRFCQEESEKQMKMLKSVSLMSETEESDQTRGERHVVLPDTVNKHIKELRKITSDLCLDNIYQKYVRLLKEQDTQLSRQALKVSNYTSECIQVCWLMAIQDPPVVFRREMTPGSKFNADLFKTYTVSGPMCAYVVWPPMFLHKGGAVLCKGVAQGSGGRKR